MGKIDSGKIWAYGILTAILAFIGLIIFSVTLVVTEAPVQKSDSFMMDYDLADLQANELINAKLAFDQKYKIEYVTESLSQEGSIIKYKVTDLEGNAVNNAKIIVSVTRPVDRLTDQLIENPSVENGIYTFESITLPKPGRWSMIAKVTIGENERYYNINADTRHTQAFEF